MNVPRKPLNDAQSTGSLSPTSNGELTAGKDRLLDRSMSEASSRDDLVKRLRGLMKYPRDPRLCPPPSMEHFNDGVMSAIAEVLKPNAAPQVEGTHGQGSKSLRPSRTASRPLPRP